MKPRDRTPHPEDGEEWFRPWRTADASLMPVVDDVATMLDANRKRAVQGHRREAFHRTVAALVANLAFAARETESGWLAVHMPTQHQAGIQCYRHPLVTVEMLKRVRDDMLDAGMLEMRKGRRGVSTTIRPTDGFRRLVASHKGDLADTIIEEGEELIILSRKTKVEVSEGDATVVKNQRHLVPYDASEHPEIPAMRADVAAINAYLAKGSLAFIDDELTPRVNVSSRSLKRHFNLLPRDGMTSRFDQGGRLFGAFWTNLDSDRRAASLRIDGEHIAEVDFNAMFTRLAYAELGMPLGDDDPYTPLTMELSGAAARSLSDDDFKRRRSIIKQAVNAFFFAMTPFSNWPKDIGKQVKAAEWSLKVGDVVGGVLHHHPALSEFLWRGVGYGFMKTESDILISGMKRIATMGTATNHITALPLHDAVLVARRHAPVVKQVLKDAAMEVVGVRLPVSFKMPD